MKQEEKELLLKDLCARLPYGVKLLHIPSGETTVLEMMNCDAIDGDIHDMINNFQPYLRPMSSMTEEERKEIGKAIKKDRISPYGEIKLSGVDNLLLAAVNGATNLIDWLNAHHFDYRGLIEKGLAIAVTEENKIKL